MRFLILISLLFSLSLAHGFESLSYSGRLVNANGSPVTGYAKLSFELAYSNNTGIILCTQNADNVSLANGVFHVGLEFPDCDLSQVVKNTPDGHSISIRVIDRTQSPERYYSFQAINSLPYALVSKTAKQLDQLGATPGQFLSWEDGEWKPKTINTEIAPGTISDEMLQGNIPRSKLAAGVANQLVVNDASGNLSSVGVLPLSMGGTGAVDAAGARTNLGAMAFTDVPSCLDHQKLKMNPGPVFWSCVLDETLDNTKLPLSGGALSGALTLAADPSDPLEAATKNYVDSQVAGVNASQWTTVGANDISYSGSATLTGSIKFKPNAYQVELKASGSTSENLQFVLPPDKGAVGLALVTDGGGNLSWAAPAAAGSSSVGGDLSGTVSAATIKSGVVTSDKIADGTITNADIAALADIEQSKIKDLALSLSNKENKILNGNAGEYLDGTKNWVNFQTSARNAVSAEGPISYNNTSGVISFLVPGSSGNLLRSNGTTWESWVPNFLTTEADTLQTVTDRGATTTTFSKFTGGASFSEIGVGTDSPDAKVSIVGDLSLTGPLKFKANTHVIELKPNATTAQDLNFILPATPGVSGQALVTDGAGNLSWAAPAAADSSPIGGDLSGTVSNATIKTNTITSSKIVDDTIVDADISATANIAQSKIAGLTTALSNKENSIASSDSTTFFRGDKTWQTLNTDAVPEGTKLYFTEQLVLGTDLVGLNSSAGTVTSSDTVLSAIGKLTGNQGNYILRDGTSTITNNLTLSNKKIIDLADPTLAQDAATKSYVDSKVGDGISNITNLDATKIATGVVDNTEFNYLNGVTSSIQTQLNAKEPTLTAGTNAQYYRGDKTWQTLNTDAVPEGTKLYFTEPLVRGTDLAGFVSGAGVISSADTVLSAIQKLDGNIGTVVTNQGNYILRDGTSVITNNLTLSNKKIINLADPTLAQDAATKAYVDSKAGESQWKNDGSDIYFDTGRVGIGNNDPEMPLHITSTGWGTILAHAIKNTNEGAEIHFSKSRGVAGSLLPVNSGDRLMSLFGSGSYSTTQFTDNVAAIEMKAAENFTGTAQGTSIEFGTTALGTTNRQTRMTIAPSGNVGINTTNPQSTLDVKGTLRLSGSTSGYVGLAPAAAAGNTTYTLPANDGSDGHLLKTNGSGVLSWVAPPSTTPTGTAGGDLSGTYPNPTITGLIATKISDGLVDNTEFNFLNGVTSNIQTQLNAKQGTITAGATSEYYRGDKTWQNFDAAARSALLFNYAVTAGTVASGDSLQTAIGKLDGNIASLAASGQWTKSGSNISYSAGSVGVGATPSASSALEISSTTKGFLPPRMTTVQRNSISSPANGLIVYDTTESDLYVYRTNTWEKVSAMNAGDGVAFKVQHHNGGGNITITGPAVVPFNNVMLDSHSAWNAAEYAFVAPQAGYYVFGWHFFTQAPDAVTVGRRVYLFVNTGSGWVNAVATGDVNATVNASTILYLEAGHKVRMEVPASYSLNTYSGGYHNSFWGVRIGTVASGSDDNMGNHTADQNIKLGSHWLSGDGGNEGIKIDTDGNVGIGQPTPTHPLHISKSVAAVNSNLESVTLRLSNPVQAMGPGGEYAKTGIAFGRDDIVRGGILYGTYGLDYMDFHVGDSGLEEEPDMRISSNGFLGLGTKNPRARLEVDGNIVSKGSSIYMEKPDSAGGWARGMEFVPLDNLNPTTSGLAGLGLHGSGSTATNIYLAHGPAPWTSIKGIQILANGNVGMGTTSPSYRLDVRSGVVNSEGGYSQTSDRRLKENIDPLENSLEKVLSLRPISYNWINKEISDSKQIGFIAQEVEEVFPEVVKTDKEGFKAMSYSELISPVVKALQELYEKWFSDHERIAKLEEENRALKAQNEEILKRLDRMEQGLEQNRAPAQIKQPAKQLGRVRLYLLPTL